LQKNEGTVSKATTVKNTAVRASTTTATTVK